MSKKKPLAVGHHLSPLFADPDLVDRIFEYILEKHPLMRGAELDQTKVAVREEFGGLDRVYVRSARAEKRRDKVREVLALFNGRNATEIARRLQISRADVYRIIKQPGGQPEPQTVSDSPKT